MMQMWFCIEAGKGMLEIGSLLSAQAAGDGIFVIPSPCRSRFIKH